MNAARDEKYNMRKRRPILLPRYITPRDTRQNSISVERALKNILDVLLNCNVDENDLNMCDRLNAAIDDTNTMLGNIE